MQVAPRVATWLTLLFSILLPVAVGVGLGILVSNPKATSRGATPSQPVVDPAETLSHQQNTTSKRGPLQPLAEALEVTFLPEVPPVLREEIETGQGQPSSLEDADLADVPSQQAS